MTPIDPTRVRALAERLIAIESVSPDPVGERRCAAAIRAELPRGLELGEWPTDDGRPVVWALLEGGSRRTVILIGHYDTVGVDEYRALGDPAGASVALRPAELRARLLDLDPESLSATVRRDLDRERRVPGSWLFGRGALDMKSGLAAGIAALESLHQDRAALEGSVLFVACPDEENQSAGMVRAVPEIAVLAARLEFQGALNLDYVESATAFEGVVGKRLLGFHVRGCPTHAGRPFAGADAAQMAATIVDRLTTSRTLAEACGGVPPVALRLRDGKPRYDVQTALEAEIELNFLSFDTPLKVLLEQVRAEVEAALAALTSRMDRLAVAAGATRERDVRSILTFDELPSRGDGAEDPNSEEVALDRRASSWERFRRAARAAVLSGPSVVIALLPPYYPQSPPRKGGLGDRLRPWLGQRGVALEDRYRHISDASYLAWRGDPPEVLQALLPGWGRDYRLPVAACSSLDLDVVTIGPWGRDAHGLFERVECRYAFEILPGLIAGAVRESVRE